MIDYSGYGVNKDLEFLKSNLPIRPANHRLSEILTLIFREEFFYSPPEEIDATRKSWTYNVALSMRAAADIFDLNCRFEVGGRFDAIVETKEKEPQKVLFAEWESEYGKVNEELEKIWNGLNNSPNADGFLLTYCRVFAYFSFVQGVIQFWQEKPLKNSNQCLYLLVVCYKKGSIEWFEYLRTIQIFQREIILWDDIPFED